MATGWAEGFLTLRIDRSKLKDDAEAGLKSADGTAAGKAMGGQFGAGFEGEAGKHTREFQAGLTDDSRKAGGQAGDEAGLSFGQAFSALAKGIVSSFVSGMRQSGRQAGDGFGEEFDQASAGRIRDTQGRFIADSKTAGAQAGDEAGRSFTQAFTALTKGIASSFTDGFRANRSGGGAGAAAAGLAARTVGGIGPGILGLSAKHATILGGAAVGLGAIPALTPVLAATGLAGAGAGVAAAGAKQLIGQKNTKASPNAQGPLYDQAQAVAKQFQETMKTAAAGMLPALKGVFGQIPGLLKSITPQLTGLFAAAGTLLGPALTGLGQLAKTVLPALSAAFRALAPLIRPIIAGLQGLIGPLLGGLTVVLKSAQPAIAAFSGGLTTIGTGLAGMLQAFAPAIAASSVVLKALFGLLGSLFPVIGKLASEMAAALGPAFTAFASVIKALLPFLTIVGQVVADLAKAVLGDLSAAFGAVVSLLKAVAPSLSAFAKALGGVFGALENSGVFAVLGGALESLAGPLGALITALLSGLTPLLPPIIGFVSQLASMLASGLSQAVSVLLPPLTTLATTVLAALAQVLPVILPLLIQLAGIFTGVVVAAVADLATALAAIISAIPPSVLQGIVIALGAVVVAVKLWAAAQAILDVALDANPIGLIALAIAGLVIGITELVKHWSSVWAVIQAVWAPVVAAAKAAVAGIVAAFAPIVAFFDRIKAAITSGFTAWWAQNGAQLEAIWNAVWAVIKAVAQAAYTYLSAVTRVELAVFLGIWRATIAVLTAVWRALWPVIQAVVGTAFAVLTATFRTAVAAVELLWRTSWATIGAVVKTVWAGIQSTVKAAFDLVVGIITVGIDLLTGKWSKAWTDIKNVAVQEWNAIKQFFSTALGAFAQAFGTAVTAIGQFWGRIKGIIRAPIAYVVDNVLDGIIRVFDTITNAIGLGKPIPEIHPFGLAAGGPGGPVQGPGGPRDDKAGLYRLSNREWVVKASSADRYGPRAMAAVNAGTATIGFAGGGTPGMAAGGQAGNPPPNSLHTGTTAVPTGDPISGLLSKVVDTGKIIAALASGNTTALTNAFKNLIGVKAAGAGGVLGSIIAKMPGFLVDKAVGWIKNAFGASPVGQSTKTTGKYPDVGSGVQRWAGVVTSMLKQQNLAAGLKQAVLYQMQTESGGDPNVVNKWDSNWTAGHPCVPLDSLILTGRGWLSHDQVRPGDYTPGWNPAAGCTEWTPVLQVHLYGLSPLVTLTAGAWSAVCTPNHRWLLDGGGFVTAAELTPEHKIRVDGGPPIAGVTRGRAAARPVWCVTTGLGTWTMRQAGREMLTGNSVGLMQVINSTFRAYAGKFLNTGPFQYGVSVNPSANVFSALGYGRATYGPSLQSSRGGIGTGHGYSLGGWINEPVAGIGLRTGDNYRIAESGREMVLREAEAQRLGAFSGGGMSTARMESLLRELVGVSRAAPGVTGATVGGQIAGGNAAAVWRARYPGGGMR